MLSAVWVVSSVPACCYGLQHHFAVAWQHELASISLNAIESVVQHFSYGRKPTTSTSSKRLHPHRITGGNRDHRHSRRHASAGAGARQGEGQCHPLRE